MTVQLAISEQLMWAAYEFYTRLLRAAAAAGSEGGPGGAGAGATAAVAASADMPVRIRLLAVDSLATRISFQGDPFSRPRCAALPLVVLVCVALARAGLLCASPAVCPGCAGVCGGRIRQQRVEDPASPGRAPMPARPALWRCPQGPGGRAAVVSHRPGQLPGGPRQPGGPAGGQHQHAAGARPITRRALTCSSSAAQIAACGWDAPVTA